MDYLGATLMQVFMRAGGADVSLRDVTIAQMGNEARECGWRHAPEARRRFWGFWKSQLVGLRTRHRTRRVDFRGQMILHATGAARNGGGGRWKNHHRKIVHLSSLCRNLQLKGNKRFRTWTKKLLRVFCVSGFLCSMYICYEHSMYVSHISVS